MNQTSFHATRVEDAIRAAREHATEALVRVNPELFAQYARYKWNSKYHHGHGINVAAIRSFVSSYDRSFNVVTVPLEAQ